MAGAQQHAAVHVGAGRERADRSRGHVQAAGGDEQAAHAVVSSGVANLEQLAAAATAGDRLQVAVELLAARDGRSHRLA